MAQEAKKIGVKSKVEAVLFSTGQRISIDEISKLCRARKEEVLVGLQELQKEYDEKQSSLMLVDEGEFWKFAVRDHFIPMVRKIVTETELSKSVMETLAVIAFKYPILQSEMIKIRTNKAYDHLVELEKSGYITRQKQGRTNLIKLTDKFFKYFDLTQDKLKEQFKDFDSIAKAIKEKEIEVENIKEDQKRKAEDLRKEDERVKKEIDEIDKSDQEFKVPLETYESKSKDTVSSEFNLQGELIIENQKIGDLEVIDEPLEKLEKHDKKEIVAGKEKAKSKTIEKVQGQKAPEKSETPNETAPENSQIQTPEKVPRFKKIRKGIKTTPEMEAKADQIVEGLLQGENSEKESKKDKNE